MTDHPYTTLWEDWRIGGSGGGTINHAWCGGALTLLSQYGAGVAPVTPGYGTYHVLPQMGQLEYIKTTVPSVKGDINVELQNEADLFSLKLNSPAGTTAIVGIPRPAGATVHRIQVNGEIVCVNGQPQTDVSGLTLLENTPDYIKFSVDPGKWIFHSFSL